MRKDCFTLIVAIMLIFLTKIAFCGTGGIIVGNEPGEIYFTGPNPENWGNSALFKGVNYGEGISMISNDNTVDFFGGLLPDTEEGHLYRLQTGYTEKLSLTRTNGFSWEIVNNQVHGNGMAYASGLQAGELYRIGDEYGSCIERSGNYGSSYQIQPAQGFPDTSNVFSMAVGDTPGEVYVLTQWNDFYFSSDSCKSFSYLSNLCSLGAPNFAYLITGGENDECYLWTDNRQLWRIANQGQSAEHIADFDSLGFGAWPTAGLEPGQLYIRAAYPNFSSYGGYVKIYNSNDYGSSWTRYVHVIEQNAVKDPNISLPNKLELELWPNPANPNFTVSYELNSFSSVIRQIFDIRGGLVLADELFQIPGNHLWQPHLPTHLSSGNYLVVLTINQEVRKQKVSIIK